MQKRWFPLLAGVVFTTFIVTTLVEAQDEGPQRRRRDRGGQREGRGGRGGAGPRGGGDLLSLLRIEEVRTEINLEKGQEESVDEIAKKLRGERGERGDRRNLRDLSEEERTKMRAERREAAEKRAAEAKKMLAGVLDEQQMKRLNQIKIQVEGVRALSDDEVAAKLEITDEQQGKIEAAEEANREKMREAMQGRRGRRDSGDREAAMKKMEELRKSAESSVLEILTKEQRDQFAAMQGKKFDMPQPRFGGRGRGDRQRGDRQRGDRPRRNRDRQNNDE
ncbi:Spy/CpxP family protein refolding chaperone [Symmachiella dynata]|uniref:Spy/CpxP family protein refolding chaperone n=1 Tax=Symmachiella dynata TaxID=2527995 RepID=UPI0030ED989C